MSDDRRIPAFESEEAEAAWWFEQRDRVAADFEKAAADGTLRRRPRTSEKVASIAEHSLHARKVI
jgi:hypothetical protein